MQERIEQKALDSIYFNLEVCTLRMDGDLTRRLKIVLSLLLGLIYVLQFYGVFTTTAALVFSR